MKSKPPKVELRDRSRGTHLFTVPRKYRGTLLDFLFYSIPARVSPRHFLSLFSDRVAFGEGLRDAEGNINDASHEAPIV